MIDYKTGRKESQSASDNLQLRTQAVCLKAARSSVLEVEAAIVEPWVSWEPQRVRYDQSGLERAALEIEAIVERTQTHAEHRAAGPWCTYCVVNAYCWEAKDYARSLYKLGMEHGVLDLPRGEHGSKIIEDIKAVRSILDGMEEGYKRMLAEDPECLDDHYLHLGKERRSLIDLPTARTRLREVMSDEELDNCATFWISKIEERFAKNRGLPLGTKSATAEKAFAEHMTGLIETSRDGAYIARRSQKDRKRRQLMGEAKEAIAQ